MQKNIQKLALVALLFGSVANGIGEEFQRGPAPRTIVARRYNKETAPRLEKISRYSCCLIGVAVGRQHALGSSVPVQFAGWIGGAVAGALFHKYVMIPLIERYDLERQLAGLYAASREEGKEVFVGR